MSLKSKLLSLLSFIDENKSEIKLSNEELKQKLKSIYETKDFSDIDFIVGQNSDQIKAHKLVLSLNDCQLIKDKNSIEVKDVTKESFETLMSSFYQQNEIQLTEDNVNDLKRLAQTLGSEKLLNKCLVFETELKLNKCFESIEPIVGHKSIKPNDGMGANSFINKWIPIPELKPSSSSTPKKRKLSVSHFTDNNEDTTRALELYLNCEQLDDISINSNNTENKSNDENDVNIDCVKNEELMTHSFDYDLENSVRIHKLSIDDRKESNIKVWKSAFKPKLMDSSEEHVIATCGGKTVALIDCHKSTEHPVVFDTVDEEQLFCNAWTVLVLDNNKDKKCAVLAIGGQSGIYLFRDPDSVLEPYRLIKGNEDAVVCLVFHGEKPNWLLSASYDRSITIHDIGSLYLKDAQIEAKQHSIIYKYVTSMTLLTICYSLKNDCLIASGESNYVLFFKDISTFA
jgi:WD40 repeat protein